MGIIGKVRWALKTRKFYKRIRKEHSMGKKWYLSKTNFTSALALVGGAIKLFMPNSAIAEWITVHSGELLMMYGTLIGFFRNKFTSNPTTG